MINKTVNRLPKSIVEVYIQAPWSDIETYWNSTLQRLSQEVEVPGFRKGTAPLGLIEQHLGSNRMQDEFLKDVMPQLLVQALQEEKIVPIDYPRYQLISFVKGQSLSFKATVTERPQVKVGDYKSISVQKPAVKQVTDEDVNKIVDDLFKRWTVRQQSIFGVKPQEQTLPSVVEDTQKSTIDSSDSGSINFSATGEDLTTSPSNQPITHPQPPSDKIPEAPNDEFAKAVGATDLNDLKSKIRADLENEARYNNELDFEEAILQQVEKITEVDVPDVLIEDELNRMMVSLQGRVSEMGLLLEDYLKTQNETVDSIRSKWREQALKNVRMELGLAEIARLENVNITDAELQAEIDKIQDARLKARFEAQEPRLHLRHSLRQLRTLDKLKGLVKTV